MQEKIKGKIKKKIISIIVACFPTIFVVTLLSIGFVSVLSFFQSFFDSKGDGKDGADMEAVMQEIQDMSLDEIIIAVDNKKIITEKALDEMMIERDTLKKLLKAVKAHNTSWDTAEKKIEVQRTYLEEYEVEVEVEEDEEEEETEKETVKKNDKNSGLGKHQVTKSVSRTKNGTAPDVAPTPAPTVTSPPKTITVIETREVTEYEWKDYSVTAEPYESPYKIDWQVIYVASVIQGIQNEINSGTNNAIIIDTEESESESSEIGSENEEETSDDDSDNILGSTEFVKTPFDDIFELATSTTGVPVNLLKAIARQESNYNAKVVSSAGAMGVMQLMPETAKGLGVTDAFDPQQNIMGGSKYIRDLLIRYDGNIVLALAGYNAGPGNVNKYGGVPPFKETQNYVVKVIGYFTGGNVENLQAIVDKYNLPINFLVTFGKFKDGRLNLTDDEIKTIIKDFSADIDYEFDVVRDKTKEYSFTDCKSLPNNGEKKSGKLDKDGIYTWYEPISKIEKVRLADRDITYNYDLNNKFSKSIAYRMDRWKSIINKYWVTYDPELMGLLIQQLPGGVAVVESYDVPVEVIKQ